MAVTITPIDDTVAVVAVDGRLDQAQNRELETYLLNLLAEGQTQLVVDLSRTSYINSGGLRCLVTSWRRARQQEGDLVLSGLNERLEEIFSMVGFDKVFRIYPSQQEALAAVTPPL